MKSLPVQAVRENVAVGARLRSARMEKRYTLDDVARLSGVTKGFLSRVERDLTSPSVASLVTLCQVLSIDVGSLFEAPQTTLVRADEAVDVDMGGTGITERLISGRDVRSVQVVRATIEPDGAGEPEPYGMDCELEVWHVISGRVEVRLHEEIYVLDAGDTLTFPGREPHTWRNLAETASEVIFTLVPKRG